ncbi:S-(hydroxymethyl)glutathione synthase [Fonsecaea monophora]|uniref:Putative glutathione-dependent formaldehyde-activating enzyme n=1 Tax=Fonsecaea monophora TaxID=254056 RepID=A0A177EY06_9EURO|nr:S-(hydroxymethyl)glutathione synthase [Fonsecaea monophora]KAH0827704.1 putative glutathione-dependent formaldehyde-activating enzyme [Fonsecaea pedrosoi]OAG36915.1 S-(hydroxymethyl)glutathione synthase [Fonsecaea monophora]
MAPSLHPLIDNGITKGKDDFPGGTLRCHCSSNPVEVELKGNVLHNHACGCSQCYKPEGALFSIVAVIPDGNVRVTKNKEKLAVVNDQATILRYACKDCGVHMYGSIEKDHAFKGLSFVHVELSDEKGWQEPQFAAFVSSLIEQGYPPEKMGEVRDRLRELGLEPYDALSPPLMDALATFTAEKAGKRSKI